MEQLYQDYKDIAHIFIVYIREAHASDGARPVAYAKKLGIKQHTTFGERCTVAGRLVKDKKLTIPCLIDNMDNHAGDAYQAWPDRVYLVRTDGTLGVAGARGPWGFQPGLEAARKWLAQYKQTGQEPPPVEADRGRTELMELQRGLFEAYRTSDYTAALGIAEKIHGLRPDSLDTIYNIACLHCLLGHEDQAYTWLEKAIDAGYSDADHLISDEDFKTIRDQERFTKIVEELRKKNQESADTHEQPAALASVVGEWEMKTDFQGSAIEATMSLQVADGKLVGTWTSQGHEMKLTDLRLEGHKLAFKRTVPGGPPLEYEGTIRGNEIAGHYRGPFGKLVSNGKREGTASDSRVRSADRSGEKR